MSGVSVKRRIDDTLCLLLMGAGFLLPLGGITEQGHAAAGWLDMPGVLAPALVAFGCAVWLAFRPRVVGLPALGFSLIGAASGVLVPLAVLSSGLVLGAEAPGLWLFLAGLSILVWRALENMSAHAGADTVMKLLVPALFGMWLLYLWEVLVIGFDVPKILLPAPSQIGDVIVAKPQILWADFQQTFLKAVISGFVFGCGSGFLVALIVDRVPFLARGLLPLGGAVSAIPIVGIAPIMVMWFGFDWQSKAAVIVVMTFFPMLVNTLAGLNSPDGMQNDLMHSYGASHRQTFLKLRMPSALPFIFNALKINSTLALIGAIVAEFFGTPIKGMGFRISTEVARMNVDTVWATIAVAALAGSVFYGMLALLERRLTFWHPSYRK